MRTASGEHLEFDYLVVCAGLQSDHFAAGLGRPGDLRIVPFRGEYYELAPGARSGSGAWSTRCLIPGTRSSACT